MVEVVWNEKPAPLPEDINDRVWAAACNHENESHRDNPNAVGYHVEYAPPSLYCKNCRAEIPVRLT